MNLPGTQKYDPSLPWVYKVGLDNKIAADLFFYIDGVRLTASSTKISWRATQKVCQMLGYLGIQDAYRKRTGPSQELEELTEISVNSTKIVVTEIVSEKKLGRSKEIIFRITIELSEGGEIDFKELEKNREHLV